MEEPNLQRAAVFIDIGYFGKVLKYCFDEPRIDFEKFSDYLCEDKERLRTYVYDCPPYVSQEPTDEEERRQENHERFASSLTKLHRFEVRLGKTAHNAVTGEFYQKRVDVLLTVDLMRMAWDRQIGTAILVTGDSDFVPVIESVKQAGVVVKLFYRDCYDNQGRAMTRTLDELLEVCDECIVIDNALIEDSAF
ncbi:MAG: NYN domain-containing protein [Candidatus Lokiarchaeota archaeon]|nr:NYN domain-containing protein [Candidatus Lokiarchaeota archaeon]